MTELFDIDHNESTTCESSPKQAEKPNGPIIHIYQRGNKVRPTNRVNHIGFGLICVLIADLAFGHSSQLEFAKLDLKLETQTRALTKQKVPVETAVSSNLIDHYDLQPLEKTADSDLDFVFACVLLSSCLVSLFYRYSFFRFIFFSFSESST